MGGGELVFKLFSGGLNPRPYGNLGKEPDG